MVAWKPRRLCCPPLTSVPRCVERDFAEKTSLYSCQRPLTHILQTVVANTPVNTHIYFMKKPTWQLNSSNDCKRREKYCKYSGTTVCTISCRNAKVYPKMYNHRGAYDFMLLNTIPSTDFPNAQ